MQEKKYILLTILFSLDMLLESEATSIECQVGLIYELDALSQTRVIADLESILSEAPNFYFSGRRF